jgi:hypothetical protein
MMGLYITNYINVRMEQNKRRVPSLKFRASEHHFAFISLCGLCFTCWVSFEAFGLVALFDHRFLQDLDQVCGCFSFDSVLQYGLTQVSCVCMLV